MLDIHIIKEERICLISLRGKMVFSEVLSFENRIHELFNELTKDTDIDPLPVLIDCRGIEIIDSSGVAVLVGAHLESKHRLILLGFIRFHESVFKVIERTGVDAILTIFQSEEKARAHLIDFERQEDRINCSITGTLRGNSEYQIRCINVSHGGLCALATEPIPELEKMFMLTLANGFQEPVYVKWRAQLDAGFEVGLGFHKEDPALIEKIDKLIKDIR